MFRIYILCTYIFLGFQFVYCTHNPSCTDKLSRLSPYNVSLSALDPTPVQVTSCRKLAKRYTSLCHTEGDPLGKCCHACHGKDLSCIDDFRPPDHSGLTSKQFRNCKKFIKADRCRCTEPEAFQTCCHTCRKTDTRNLDCSCRDIFNLKIRPSFTIHITVTYAQKRNMEKLVDNQELRGCSDFRDWYPYFCHQFNFCCKSCKGVDSTCIDNLKWQTTVELRSEKCTNCNCHEIARKSPRLMKYVCKNNVVGTDWWDWLPARIACCHQCKRLGYDKPLGYFIDPKLEFKLKSSSQKVFIPGKSTVLVNALTSFFPTAPPDVTTPPAPDVTTPAPPDVTTPPAPNVTTPPAPTGKK